MTTNPMDLDVLGEADFRGPYGYGRRAHMSDPNASYGFEPDPNRALPARGEFVVLEPGPADNV